MESIPSPIDIKLVKIAGEKRYIRGGIDYVMSLKRYGGFQYWRRRRAYLRAGLQYPGYLCGECSKAASRIEPSLFQSIYRKIKQNYYRLRYHT